MIDKNPYFSFRKVGDLRKIAPFYPQGGGNALGKEYDEPTYLTFRLVFESRGIDNKTDVTDFDQIPQPLFSTEVKPIAERNEYSTLQYLGDMDENIRYEMMGEFIEKWNQLQTNYQWYFQSVEGIADLLRVNPIRGRRIGQDVRITIKTLEGLDQRVSHLLNLYKKIAWDDVYQRWVLPDIMRYFRLNIYVTEFRTFHRSYYNMIPSADEQVDQYNRRVDDWRAELRRAEAIGDIDQLGGALSAQPNLNLLPTTGREVLLTALSNVSPTYVLELERCEFDIESLEILPNSLDIGNPEMREVNFSIKVGNLKEKYVNPTLNIFLYDTIINGFSRTAPVDETVVIGKAQGRFNKSIILGTEALATENAIINEQHTSGRPFNRAGTTNSDLKNSIPTWANSTYKSIDEVNPTDPTTWAGNALNLGKAFVENLVEGAIDKASIQKIPGLGVSFNEALTAIQSKNVLSLFSVARRAFETNIEGTLPSQELTENFVDTQFKEFLVNIAKSEATDSDPLETNETAEAAKLILSDRGVWEEIKDYSKATDLISEVLAEINSDNKIKNPNSLKSSYIQEYIQPDIKDGLIYEGLPSSLSTQSKLSNETGLLSRPESGASVSRNISEETGIIPQESAGEATDGDTSLKTGPTTELGSTDGNIKQGIETESASSDLGSNAGSPLSRPEDGLGGSAEGGLDMVKAGENLGSSTQGGGLDTANPSRDLGSNAGTQLSRPGDGLGEAAQGDLQTINPSQDLGTNAGTPLPRPGDGLGENAQGDLKTAEASRDLGTNAGTQLSRPGEGIGQKIDNKGISVPKPGEATDGDKIIGNKLSTTDTKSEATNDNENIKT